MTEPETTTATETPAAPDTGAPEGAATDSPEPSWEDRLNERINAAFPDPDQDDDAPEGEEAAGAEAEQEAGEAAEAEAAEAGAGPEAVGEEAAEEAEGTAAEAGADDGAGAADEGDAPVLRLPGRHEDDPDIEIALTAEQLEAAGIDAQAFTERQNQLRNGYMRGTEVREAREEVRAEREELDFIANELQTRPAEFVAQHVNPQHYRDLARQLLVRLPDEDFRALVADVDGWDQDPATRREARAAAREEELDRRDQGRQRKSATDYATGIRKSIARVIPPDMDDARADDVFQFAVMKLEQWAHSQPRGTRLDPEQVPALLEELGALAPFGITVSGDGDGGANTRSGRPTPSSAERRNTRPADQEPGKRAARSGQDLRKRAESRKNAATVAPAGAGSAVAADAAPPRGQTFEERMGWLEKRLGLKKK